MGNTLKTWSKRGFGAEQGFIKRVQDLPTQSIRADRLLRFGENRPPKRETHASCYDERQNGVVAQLLAANLRDERVDTGERVGHRVHLRARVREATALAVQRILRLERLSATTTISQFVNPSHSKQPHTTRTHSMMLLVMEREESNARRSFKRESISASSEFPFRDLRISTTRPNETHHRHHTHSSKQEPTCRQTASARPASLAMRSTAHTTKQSCHAIVRRLCKTSMDAD